MNFLLYLFDGQVWIGGLHFADVGLERCNFRSHVVDVGGGVELLEDLLGDMEDFALWLTLCSSYHFLCIFSTLVWMCFGAVTAQLLRLLELLPTKFAYQLFRIKVLSFMLIFHFGF